MRDDVVVLPLSSADGDDHDKSAVQTLLIYVRGEARSRSIYVEQSQIRWLGPLNVSKILWSKC